MDALASFKSDWWKQFRFPVSRNNQREKLMDTNQYRPAALFCTTITFKVQLLFNKH